MVITSCPFGTRRRVCAAGTVMVSAATKSSSVSSAPHCAQSSHSYARQTFASCASGVARGPAEYFVVARAEGAVLGPEERPAPDGCADRDRGAVRCGASNAAPGRSAGFPRRIRGRRTRRRRSSPRARRFPSPDESRSAGHRRRSARSAPTLPSVHRLNASSTIRLPMRLLRSTRPAKLRWRLSRRRRPLRPAPTTGKKRTRGTSCESTEISERPNAW